MASSESASQSTIDPMVEVLIKGLFEKGSYATHAKTGSRNAALTEALMASLLPGTQTGSHPSFETALLAEALAPALAEALAPVLAEALVPALVKALEEIVSPGKGETEKSSSTKEEGSGKESSGRERSR